MKYALSVIFHVYRRDREKQLHHDEIPFPHIYTVNFSVAHKDHLPAAAESLIINEQMRGDSNYYRLPVSHTLVAYSE